MDIRPKGNFKGIPIGVDDFKRVIEKNSYYVDKSLFIKEIIDDDSEVKLITRPRRFGKTLNLSMLRYFFEKTDEKTSYLFEHLNIWQEGKYYQDEQGKYPVIYLTLKDVKQNNISDCIESMKNKIAEEFRYHSYLLTSDKICESEIKVFHDIINRTASNIDFQNSLLLLSKLLHDYYDEYVVILMDEYDTPINHAFVKGYYEEAIDFMKGFLGPGLKGNEHLKTAVITGVYRVAKESIFSDVNNLDVSSILENTYCDKFGFTENEVEEIMDYYGIQSKKEEVKSWYNGYVFGEDTVIYNPWSIINYAKYKIVKPYWVNTSSNDLIKEILGKTDASVKQKMGLLITGEAINDIVVNTNTNFRDILDNKVLNEEVLWNFLVISGYLKVENTRITKDGDIICDIKIPNKELYKLFRDIIAGWFDLEDVSSNTIKIILNNLVNGDMDKFQDDFKYLVRKTFGQFDVGRNKAENFYHAFTLGLLVNLDGKYRVISNRESGDGRPDVIILPKDTSKKAIIMEFKIAADCEDETMQRAVEIALKQIKEKNYIDEINYSGIKEVIKIGIAFCGKTVALGYEMVKVN